MEANNDERQRAYRLSSTSYPWLERSLDVRRDLSGKSFQVNSSKGASNPTDHDSPTFDDVNRLSVQTAKNGYQQRDEQLKPSPRLLGRWERMESGDLLDDAGRYLERGDHLCQPLTLFICERKCYSS
ncbi:hypothetical protein AB6A40_000748 [Gnathostoma spinigerum]|uniref:Uncharacterized protein n=1 Tax=Gnathostoma spinigerum TaxID=75299 RepID=A0ABD6E2P6_9BILA